MGVKINTFDRNGRTHFRHAGKQSVLFWITSIINFLNLQLLNFHRNMHSFKIATVHTEALLPTDGEVTHGLKEELFWELAHELQGSFLQVFNCLEVHSSQGFLELRKQCKIAWREVRWIGWMCQEVDSPFFKFCHGVMRSVQAGVVHLEDEGVSVSTVRGCPQLRTFFLDRLLHLGEGENEPLCSHCPSLFQELCQNDAFLIKKNSQHCFLSVVCTAWVLRARLTFLQPNRTLSLGLLLECAEPTFITSDNSSQEIVNISSPPCQVFVTELCSHLLLCLTQECGHQTGSSFPEFEVLSQNVEGNTLGQISFRSNFSDTSAAIVLKQTAHFGNVGISSACSGSPRPGQISGCSVWSALFEPTVPEAHLCLWHSVLSENWSQSTQAITWPFSRLDKELEGNALFILFNFQVHCKHCRKHTKQDRNC